MQHATKCVHANTIVTKAFLCVPGMDSSHMKLVPCSILDSFSVQLIKYIGLNGMPSFPQLSSESVTHQLSQTKSRR